MIADVCTGSGCIAITIAKQIREAAVVASDISPAAIGVARKNAEKHSVSDKVMFHEGDLLEAIPRDQGMIDILLSNPPYISQTEYDALSKEVRNFEPKQALLSGPTGLEVTQRLLEQAIPRVSQGGVVMIETSPMLAPKLEDWIRSRPEFELKQTIKDLQQHPRIVVAVRK